MRDIVDADGHVLEPADLWEANLPEGMRDRGIRMRWNPDTQWDERFVEDRMLSDRGVAGLGNAGQSYEDYGRGMHYEDLHAAGFDPSERVKVLDAEGIDVAVLYPGLGLALGGIRDPELAVASCRVYNDWIADYAAAAPDRLYGVGALPMQDADACAAEVHRMKDGGLRREMLKWAVLFVPLIDRLTPSTTGAGPPAATASRNARISRPISPLSDRATVRLGSPARSTISSCQVR